ncbi:MAG: hypothetical protein RR336_09630, partial [Oscillospiraceae bacterium]
DCALEPMNQSSLETISAEASADLIALVRSLPQGVISMSKKSEGVVQTSSNIGVIKLENGVAEIGTSSRSSVTDDVNQMETASKKVAEQYGYEYVVSVKYPGYDGDPDSPLMKLTERAYLSMDVQAEPIAIHAGLECSWFAFLREGIQMVCIGPTVENAHTTSETLYVDTVEPVIQAILYCLEHMNEIERV